VEWHPAFFHCGAGTRDTTKGLIQSQGTKESSQSPPTQAVTCSWTCNKEDSSSHQTVSSH
jgi:hypothetical protein